MVRIASSIWGRSLFFYVQRTGFEGIPPLPKEFSSTIENARRLPALVEEA